MELQDFTTIVRRGDFIDTPSELRLIGPLLNKKEMKELFEFVGRNAPYYHPYYIPYERHCWDFYRSDDEEWKKYKEYFINKIKEYYQGPDIILARKETKGGIAYHPEYSGKCQVLMLANKNTYELPPHTDEYSQNADKSFKQFHDKMRRTMDAQGEYIRFPNAGDMQIIL